MTVGYHGSMLRTTDKGTTWNVISSYVTANDLSSIVYTGSNTGYISGKSGTILKTLDSGTTWTSCTSGTSESIYSLFFTDNYTGYASGSGALLKTTDAGNTWISTYSGTPGEFTQVYFPTTSTGYVLMNLNSLLKTSDAGTTWNQLTSFNYTYTGSLFFTSADTGYLCGSNGKIFKTTNGGNSFNTLTSGTTIDLSSIHFISKNTGLVSGYGIILKTTDGGVTWVQKYSGTHSLGQFSFLDPLNGYCLGSNAFLKTVDGGETWLESPWDITNYYTCDLFFTSPDTGFIVGYNGMILKTTNGVITDIQSKKAVTGMKIFPNPNHGTFFIELPRNSKSTILVQLLNLSGVKIFNGILPCNSGKTEIQLEGIPHGYYVIKIISYNEVRTGKVLIN